MTGNESTTYNPLDLLDLLHPQSECFGKDAAALADAIVSTLPPKAFHQLLEAMQANDAADGLVARAANRRLGQNEREVASMLSTAQRHTHFLDSTSIAVTTLRTDFRFADLARSTGTVLLV